MPRPSRGRLGKAFLGTLLGLGLSHQTAAAPRVVGVELVLAVDTSASVDAQEYALQMSGIAAALRSAEVIDLIAELPGGVAVTLLHWSLGSANRQALAWHHLDDPTSILAFADLVETAPRVGAGRGTAIGDAIATATELIETNDFDGRQRKIDISGDSRSNSGAGPRLARDRAVAKQIVVNGLAILDGDAGLQEYYRQNVIGGEGAFVLAAEGRRDFARAMKRKLERELDVLISRNWSARSGLSSPKE